MVREGAGRLAAAADLLPAQTDLLLQLLDLAVAVALLLCIVLLPPHVALHQLDGRDERLRDAEVSVLLHTAWKGFKGEW